MNSHELDAKKLNSLEHSLALSPKDGSLWEEYETLLSREYDRDLPEETWRARQFLYCLRSNLADPEPLNRLVRYYMEKGQAFNAMMCRLASLSADPNQSGLSRTAKNEYDRGIFEPASFIPTEPITCTVSVLLATVDRPTRLREAISSVLNQTFQDFELLVINDGGSRKAQEVVNSFNSSKIRYFYKERGGHRSALNLGLKNARGKYIAYLDDDDIYFPNHLETLVREAEVKDLDFVCSRERWVVGRWDGNRWIETQDLTKKVPTNVSRLHQSAIIADLTVLHTRSLAERVGLFWEEPPRGGEWEYWVRCWHHVPLKRIETVTGEVRVNSIVPLNQPARSQFYTELWRRYFGSAFGEVILAVTAWHDGDKEKFWQHMKRIDGFWKFLDKRSIQLLWDISLSCRDVRSKKIVARLTEAQPARVGLNFYRELHSPRPWRAITKIPWPAFGALARYVLRNPRYFLYPFRKGK